MLFQQLLLSHCICTLWNFSPNYNVHRWIRNSGEMWDPKKILSCTCTRCTNYARLWNTRTVNAEHRANFGCLAWVSEGIDNNLMVSLKYKVLPVLSYLVIFAAHNVFLGVEKKQLYYIPNKKFTAPMQFRISVVVLWFSSPFSIVYRQLCNFVLDVALAAK